MQPTTGEEMSGLSRVLPSNLSIATKLVAGFVLITMLCGVISGVGLYYIDSIETTLNELTDTAAPTVETADDLIINIKIAHEIVEEIAAAEELTDVERLERRFANLKNAFAESFAELRMLVSDQTIAADLENTLERHGEFVDFSNKMFNHRKVQISEHTKGNVLLAEFDTVGAKLISALDEFALENEAEMAAAEEEGDKLEAASASAAAVNEVLGQLFDQDYPVVEAALKLQRLTMELQDNAGEYLAEDSIEELETITSEFSNLYAKIESHLDVLTRLAETEEDRNDTVNLRALFASWSKRANGDEQLFDTQRDMLRAKDTSLDFKSKSETEAEQISGFLNHVAEQADAINRSADEKAAGTVAEAQFMTQATLGTSVVLAVALIVMVLRTIVRPINSITSVMGELASGNNDIEIPALSRFDEIGNMAKAVQVFKENAIRNKELEAEQDAEKTRSEENARLIRNKLADEFQSAVGSIINGVSSAATEMQASAQALAATSEETTRQSSTVAEAAEETSANVQAVSSAAEQLASSIAEISRQVDESEVIAVSAVNNVDETNERVQYLTDGVEKIGEVVALITDIAEKTNLLALNATIEAARAGESGKGFAVVASEVKELAGQTAKATEEIGAQIREIQDLTRATVSSIGTIGETIQNNKEIANAIASAVGQQGSATQEIARNMEKAASGTIEVTTNIAGVSESASETGQSSHQLLEAASELSEQSETLSYEVDKFLTKVRAG